MVLLDATIAVARSTNAQTLWSRSRVPIGTLVTSPANSIGGWTVTPHKRRDRRGQRLYHGDGTRRTAPNRFTGLQLLTETPFPNGSTAGALAVTADGTIYYSTGRRIFRRHPTGVIDHFAGQTHSGSGCAGDVEDPLQAEFGGNGALGQADIMDMAVGPDDSLYVADRLRIQRIHPDGRVRLVAATDLCGPVPVGVTELPGEFATRVSVGGDESIYFASVFINTGPNARIWRISPRGTLESWVVGAVDDLVIDAQGLVVFSTSTLNRLWPDGRVELLLAAGNGGEGQPAESTSSNPGALAIASDGSIVFRHGYFANGDSLSLIRQIKGGLLERVAGAYVPNYPGFDPSATDPFGVAFAGISQLAVHPDGSLLTLERTGTFQASDHVVRRIGSIAGLGEFSVERNGETFDAVPSEHGGSLYLFDAENRHRETIDSTTSETILTFGYDAENRLVSIADNFSNTLTITRDASGQATQIVAPFGQVTTLSYDANGYLSQVQNPESEMVSMTYGFGGLLATLVDPLGRLHEYDYDAGGRLLLDDMPLGKKTLAQTVTPIDEGIEQIVTLTTELGRQATYRTTDKSSAACPLANTGPCVERIVTDSAGAQVTSYDFHDGSRVVDLADGSRFTIFQARDPRFGLVTSHVSATTVEVAGGPTVSAIYDHGATLADPADPLSVTELSRSVTVNGGTWSWLYDVTNRQVSSSTPEGRSYSAVLDTEGRIVSETVPGVLPVDYEYDAQGRLFRITQGERETVHAFDATSGFLEATSALEDVTGGIGEYQTVTFGRDDVGRVVQAIAPDSATTGFAYDDAGNLTSIDPAGTTDDHSFNYSPAVDSYTPPDLGDGFARQESWHVDADGATERETLADGTELTSTFDPTSGRLLQLDISDGTQTIMSYESSGPGRLSSVVQSEPGHPDVGLTFGYAGPELQSITYSEAGVALGTVAYDQSDFHDLGQIVETIDGAEAVTFTFDNDELLASAGALSVARDPQNGRVTGTALDGMSTTVGYESHGDPDLHVVSYGGVELYRSELTYDRLGRVSQDDVTIGGVLETRQYVYDANGRLAQVFDDIGTLLEDYDYDGRNNRTSVLGINPATIAVDDQDQLVSQDDLILSYNLRGDLEAIDRSGQITQLAYDATSTLRQVTLPDTTVIEYHLDPEGDWLGRSVDGVRTDTYIAGPSGRPLAHIDVATGTRTRFVYGELPTTPSYMDRGGVRYGFVTDGRGSVRLVVRLTDGVVVQRIDYDSYGRVLADSNPGFQPFGFAGGLYDPATKLVRMGARTYVPELGRFLQRDPAGFPDGPNRYGYVAGDPINFIDPSGLLRWSTVFRWSERGSNLAAGVMDEATFGLTRKLRQALDVDDQIDRCSGWYRAGQAIDEISGYVSGVGAIRGLAKKGLKYAKKRLKKGCKASFVAGTPVATPDGLREIEHVAPGDQVLCRDEQTGVEGVCTVTSTFSRTSTRTLQITLRDELGQLERFETTANHPFFTGRFLPAGHLRPGDVVYGLDDQLLIVESVSWGDIATVYNFEVARAHSYFVGESGVWVHNCPASRRMTPDQEALKELVDDLSLGGRRPLSRADADSVLDWADEVNYPGRRAKPNDVTGNHPGTKWNGRPHIHIPGAGRGGHVPVAPGVRPR